MRVHTRWLLTFTCLRANRKIAPPAFAGFILRIRLISATTLLALTFPAFGQVQKPVLELEECRISAGRGYPSIKARCGTFERHENPGDTNSPLIELSVAVVPALSLEPAPDPFVPIAGGPGQSSIAFYAGYATAFEKVRRNRDILLIDQRGTGDSAPLVCEFDEAVGGSEMSREETIALTEQCLEALPHDPRFFTTSVAVADLEALRIALGYPQLNLYGISYGSRVAQHFVRQHPDSTRSVILDGVVAPQVPLGPAIATDAQDAIDFVFDRCAESEACAERYPNLENDFDGLIKSLAEEPATISVADPLTGKVESGEFDSDEAAMAFRLLSYHPTTAAMIPLLIDEAVNGNFAPLAAQAMMIAEDLGSAINIGMHNAVVCTEDAPYYDENSFDRDALAETYLGPAQLEAMEAMCSVWPEGVIDDQFHAGLNNDIPTLILSGEGDPVTPPAYADLAAADLGNALHLIGKKQGHGLALRGCTPNLIGQFIDEASFENLETDCLDRVHAMPFFLDFSGPSP